MPVGNREVQQAEQELRETQAKAESAILAARQKTALLKVCRHIPRAPLQTFFRMPSLSDDSLGARLHHLTAAMGSLLYRDQMLEVIATQSSA